MTLEVTVLGSVWWEIDKAGSAFVISRNGRHILFDCGKNASENIHRAGIPLDEVSHLFFTHHHMDHDIDFPQFAYASWFAGRTEPLEVYGPTDSLQGIGTRNFVEGLIGPDGVFGIDIAGRKSTGYYHDRGIDANVHELNDRGFVCEIDELRITAEFTDHVTDMLTFGYRIDAPEGSVVITGDTVVTDEICEFSRGADVLLHDCLGHDKYFEDNEELFQYHSSARQAGELAAKAGVRTLVGVHHMPELDNRDGKSMMQQEVGKVFDGEFLFAEDLMRLSLP